MMRLIRFFLMGLAAAPCVADCLAPVNQQALFFPTFGYRSSTGQGWVVPVQGWLFQPEAPARRRRELRGLLREALQIPASEKTNPFFLARSDAFLVHSLNAQQLTVTAGAPRVELHPSDAGGHVIDQLTLPGTLSAGWQTLGADACAVQPPAVTWSVELLEPQGRLVVSDVDDTIKVTGVGQRSTMIANTFLKSFEAVPGMAEVYRRWAAEDATTAFCYMSASPWQLYSVLADFLRDAGFPRGVLELKRFRVKDRSFFSLFESPIAYKTPLLDELARHFPQRRFLLIGDSGEKDPEIYGAFARAHPTQVERIYIRELSAGANAARYAQAFAGVAAERWSVFHAATEIRA